MILALTAIAVLLLILDWRQTLQIARDPGRRELNPILGPKPSVGRVNVYFAAWVGVLIAGAFLLPHIAALVLMLVVIAVETWTVSRNYRRGLRL